MKFNCNKKCKKKSKKRSNNKEISIDNPNTNLDYIDIETVYNDSTTQIIPNWGPVVNPNRAWIGYGLGEDMSIYLGDDYGIANWISLTPGYTLANLIAPLEGDAAAFNRQISPARDIILLSAI